MLLVPQSVLAMLTNLRIPAVLRRPPSVTFPKKRFLDLVDAAACDVPGPLRVPNDT